MDQRLAPSRRPRVVIVEDDPALLSALQFSLEAEGYEVCAFVAQGELLSRREAFLGASCLVLDYRQTPLDGLELYALLRQHSVLARLMPADGSSPTSAEAFLAGVEAARQDGALGHQLFAVRTLGLFERLAAEQLPDYLSGLLIGHEIAHELAAGMPECLALVGDPALCGRYALALGRFGVTAPLQLDNTAPAGLWQLAQTMGL